jgi:hypothetical protein
MKIQRFEDSGKDNWISVQVSEEEALHLIQSLTTQLINKNPNHGRLESRITGDDFNGFFTIGVLPNVSD